MNEGIERISSGELSLRMNVTASQIRQDLNNFGGFGQTGYGYNVSYLYNEIGKILGLNNSHDVIIIGAGHLGQAIVNYSNFEKRGFVMKALFDINPDLIGKKIGGIPVYSVDDLEKYLARNPVPIAALTLPKEAAEGIAHRLVTCGVKGIWNFAHTDLALQSGIVGENVHLWESLMRISYRLANIGEEK